MTLTNLAFFEKKVDKLPKNKYMNTIPRMPPSNIDNPSIKFSRRLANIFKAKERIKAPNNPAPKPTHPKGRFSLLELNISSTASTIAKDSTMNVAM